MRRLGLVLLLLVAGCSSGTGASGDVNVVAAAYPLAWLAQQVAGPDAQVRNLVKTGAEPHDVELTARQVGDVQQADLVVYLKGFQAALDDALGDREQGLDVASLSPRRGKDPHVWLDPLRMQTAGVAIADRLAREDPTHAEAYRARAREVGSALTALDAHFRSSLANCARKDLVTSHQAFGYLASRYGLVERGISGFSPEAEPSPRQVADVARFARSHGVTTIFFESLVDPKVARTVASEIGARTAVLDPIEGVKEGDDYLVVQRRNAQALHDALGCR